MDCGSKTEFLEELRKAIDKGEVEKTVELTKKGLALVDAREMLKVLQDTMRRIGILFEEQVIFLPELYMSARAMQASSDILKPELGKLGGQNIQGKIVLGAVENDIHDIGKNIVKAVLEANGFQIYDIGINCPANKFVDKALEVDADIIGMSSLLTITMPEIIKVIEALHKLKLKKPILTLVGGAPVTQAFAERVGADGFAPDAFDAVRAASELVAKRRATNSGN